MAETHTHKLLVSCAPLIMRGRSNPIICPSPALVSTHIARTTSHLTMCDSNKQLALRLFADLDFGEYQH